MDRTGKCLTGWNAEIGSSGKQEEKHFSPHGPRQNRFMLDEPRVSKNDVGGGILQNQEFDVLNMKETHLELYWPNVMVNLTLAEGFSSYRVDLVVDLAACQMMNDILAFSLGNSCGCIYRASEH